MTLVNCEDSSIFLDSVLEQKLLKKLNKKLRGKTIKIAQRNGILDLEFGLSGQYWRIRAGEKIP